MGFEPTIRGKPYDDLANRCLQPLGHLSVAQTPIVSTVSRQTFTENRGEKRDDGRMRLPRKAQPAAEPWIWSVTLGRGAQNHRLLHRRFRMRLEPVPRGALRLPDLGILHLGCDLAAKLGGLAMAFRTSCRR